MMFLPSCCPTCFNPHPIVRLDVSKQKKTSTTRWVFQSSSNFRLDVRTSKQKTSSKKWCFNPHSIVRLNVSNSHQVRCARHRCFNPHPIARLDDRSMNDIELKAVTYFNPHSIVKLNVITQTIPLRNCNFNPHPIVKLDVSLHHTIGWDAKTVSILIQLLDWM